MKDKIAVVTGASQGIGEAVARRFPLERHESQVLVRYRVMEMLLKVPAEAVGWARSRMKGLVWTAH